MKKNQQKVEKGRRVGQRRHGSCFSDLLTSVARSVLRSSRAAMAVGGLPKTLLEFASSLSLSPGVFLLSLAVTNLKARLIY